MRDIIRYVAHQRCFIMHKILMSGLLLFASSSYGWNYHLHVYNQTGYNAHFNATTDIIDGHGGVSPMTGDIAANADQPINLSTKYQWKDLTYQARGQNLVGDALSLQMQKTNHAPLNQTQWIGAHNAAISAQYSTSTSLVNVSYSDPNQYLNITQQLNDGVRFIELDLRWFN